MNLRSMKSNELLKEFLTQGWNVARKNGGHTILKKGPEVYSFSFHGNETVGKPMLAKILKKTSLVIQ